MPRTKLVKIIERNSARRAWKRGTDLLELDGRSDGPDLPTQLACISGNSSARRC